MCFAKLLIDTLMLTIYFRLAILLGLGALRRNYLL